MGKRPGTGSADEPVPVRAGARFPSAKRLAKASSGDEEGVVPERDDSEKPSRSSGARFPAEQHLEKNDDPEPAVLTDAYEPAPQWPSEPAEPELRPAESAAFEDEPEEIAGPRVRPYVLTRGRTHSSYELRLETMVSVRADAVWEGTALGTEYQPVRALCATPRSVAEVAALLSMPIGVVRVLLSDLADLGVMHIHGTERTAEGRPPVALMRRVLDGLQKL